MKIWLHTIASIVMLTLTSCNSIYLIKPYDGPEILELTNFCKLNEAESGNMIKTIAYYTGVEEYWGLTSKSNCWLDNKIYLNTDENYVNKLNKKLDRKISHIHNNYWKYSLKMEITGRIEKENGEIGYGHLGLNEMQITPYQIRILGKDKHYQIE